MLTPEQVKQQFRARGETFADWARARGYRPNQVVRVINGFEKCIRGQAHDIAVQLGIKADPNQPTDTN